MKPTPEAAIPGFYPEERKRYQDRTTAAVRELAHELLVEMQEADIRSVVDGVRTKSAPIGDAQATKVFKLHDLLRILSFTLAKYVAIGTEPISNIAAGAFDRPLHREVAERLAVKIKKPRSFVAAVWAEHGKPHVRGES